MVDRNANMIKNRWGKRLGGWGCRRFGAPGKTISRMGVWPGRGLWEGIAVSPNKRSTNRFASILALLHSTLNRRSADPFLPLAFCLCLGSCAVRSGAARGERPPKLDEQFWLTVEKADVVYVGETHDDVADHRYELNLVRGLVKRKVQFAIGWEMFDKTQQAKLNALAAGAISLKEMLVETDFAKHWGIYSPAYEQILQIAGKAGVPNIALNAPPELPRKIARGTPLTPDEKAMVPTGFVAAQKGYKNFVAMMGDHPGMNEADERRFFDAQNTWDQTMASRILEFKLRNPKVLLLVLTGRGHVSGGFGIPFYVRQKATFKQIIFAGDRTSDPRHLQRPGGKSVPIVFRNSGSLSLRMAPKTGSRRLIPWPYFANLPLNS
jgi:uncharacterized iron-regulated protein